MKVSRTFHMRPPRATRQCTPEGRSLPTKFSYIGRDGFVASPKGGATVVVSGDTDNPGFVFVQVVFCSRKDYYDRKQGRALAMDQASDVLALRDLPAELRDIEHQMLCQYHSSFINQEWRRDAYSHSWDFSINYFLPRSPAVVAGTIDG